MQFRAHFADYAGAAKIATSWFPTTEFEKADWILRRCFTWNISPIILHLAYCSTWNIWPPGDSFQQFVPDQYKFLLEKRTEPVLF
jgi:hypothetical protein